MLHNTTPLGLAALLEREIVRCMARIAECEAREAELGPQPDLKLRAANDRDRDRTFISLRRAMKMLRDAQEEQPLHIQPQPPIIPVPRGARCPCSSGLKYKRCHGWVPPTAKTSKQDTCRPNGFEFSNRVQPPTPVPKH